MNITLFIAFFKLLQTHQLVVQVWCEPGEGFAAFAFADGFNFDGVEFAKGEVEDFFADDLKSVGLADHDS